MPKKLVQPTLSPAELLSPPRWASLWVVPFVAIHIRFKRNLMRKCSLQGYALLPDGDALASREAIHKALGLQKPTVEVNLCTEISHWHSIISWMRLRLKGACISAFTKAKWAYKWLKMTTMLLFDGVFASWNTRTLNTFSELQTFRVAMVFKNLRS